MKLEYILLIIVLLHYLYSNYQEKEIQKIENFDERRFSKSLVLYLKTEKHNYLEYLMKLQELMVEFQNNNTIYSPILTYLSSYRKLVKHGDSLDESHVIALLDKDELKEPIIKAKLFQKQDE
jgi:hypothetical protein